MKKIGIVFCLCLLLTGCVYSEPKIAGFVHKTYSSMEYDGNKFELTGQEKNIQVGGKLRVYIDGNATTGGLFRKKAVLKNPVAAQLAQKDKSPSILYLNRPCYFYSHEYCSPQVWEEGRYAQELVDEMVGVLMTVIKKHHIKEIDFVGYDGGAAMALLVANRLVSKRVNVSKVITVAGILDTEQYALLTDEKFHENNANPAKEAFLVSQIPQVHMVGKLDKVVPATLVQVFKKKLLNPVSYEVHVYPSADHYNWAQFKMNY